MTATQMARPTLAAFLAGEPVRYAAFSGEPLTATWRALPIPHLVVRTAGGAKRACPVMDRHMATSFFVNLDLAA
jgi:hypothetical protein